ncbi:tyrosine-type recombinase/integrase, partial [Candidatus Woesearchaeota archaeon]|nr:tyrosine-type recombinase/integrase [Candidatus Woesearchaeota archaeon]
MGETLVDQIADARKESVLSGFARSISVKALNTQKAYLTDLVVFFRELFPEHWRMHKKFNPVALDVAVQWVLNEIEENAEVLPVKYKTALPAIRKVASTIKHRHSMKPIIKQEGNMLYMNLNPVPETSLEEIISVNKKDIQLVQTVFRDNIEYMGAEFFKDIFTMEKIGAVLGHLKHHHGNSNNTIRRKMTALKLFELYLEDKGLVDRLMMHKMPLPRHQRMPQPHLEYHELFDMVIEAIDESYNPDKPSQNLQIRDKAIYSLIGGTGIRASECCNIKTCDISKDHVLVTAKGGNKRNIEIPSNAKKWLRHYEQHREKIYTKILDEEYYFLSRHGRKIDRNDIFRNLRKYVQKAGIDKKLNPHTIRRTKPTKMNDQVPSIVGIKHYLEHSNYATTAIYFGHS